MQEVAKGKVPNEKEMLSEADQFNEMIMTSLRTVQGFRKQQLQPWAHILEEDGFWKEVNRIKKEGGLIEADGRIFIPEPKLYISDTIIGRLFQ